MNQIPSEIERMIAAKGGMVIEQKEIQISSEEKLAAINNYAFSGVTDDMGPIFNLHFDLAQGEGMVKRYTIPFRLLNIDRFIAKLVEARDEFRDHMASLDS